MTATVDRNAEPPAGDGRPDTDAPGDGRSPEPSLTESLVRLGAAVAVIAFLTVRYSALPALIVVGALIVFIFLHELGHYLTARWAGMKVTEFFIGFGPRLWSFRRGETEYGIKGIPAGAYVRIIGMSNLEEVDPADEARTYRQKSYGRRMSVAVAGSTMHFILAVLLLFILLVGYGSPFESEDDQWTVGGLSALETGASPAQEAGFEAGDRIVSVDGRPVGDFDALRDYLVERPDQEVEFVVERDGSTEELVATLANRNPEGEAVGFLGVGPRYDRVPVGVVEAAATSVTTTGENIWLSLKTLGAFFSPGSLTNFFSQPFEGADETVDEQEASEVEGDGRVISILGAVRLGGQALEAGVPQLLLLLSVLNVFIGVFNLIPLLPLDGGHVAIATYERVRSRPGRRYFADVAKLLPLTYGVVLVLVLVGVMALYLDASDPIGNPFQ